MSLFLSVWLISTEIHQHDDGSSFPLSYVLLSFTVSSAIIESLIVQLCIIMKNNCKTDVSVSSAMDAFGPVDVQKINLHFH